MECRKAILQTLAYSDIFDYPLTKIEIWKFLISPEEIRKKEFEESLLTLSLRDPAKPRSKQSLRFNEIATSSGEAGLLAMTSKYKFYFLPNRSKIICKRLRREKESGEKLGIAQKIAAILSKIPTIYLIGVSGNMAMNNAEENDDIDFFIITRKNTLWTTRLLILLILTFLGKRRKRGEKNVKDKICVNMLIDETALKMPKQNLYTAHEVVQLIPVFERNRMYDRFIDANRWVEKYLPNMKHGTTRHRAQNNTKSFFGVILCKVLFSSVFEYLARQLQLYFIKKHQTTETISGHLMAFHPMDYQEEILREYNDRLIRMLTRGY